MVFSHQMSTVTSLCPGPAYKSHGFKTRQYTPYRLLRVERVFLWLLTAVAVESGRARRSRCAGQDLRTQVEKENGSSGLPKEHRRG